MNRPFAIIKVSKGLSLNDCYWVTEEDFKGSFEQYNLYVNHFSRVLGQIAFTGYVTGTSAVISSSPELTTNGMLPKCWSRQDGVMRLYKGGTMGASNTGYEPYSEFYAYQIAEILGVNAVPYELVKWKGTLCSVCKLFTFKEVSFVSVGRIVRKGGMPAVRKFYEELGDLYVTALNEMLVFDAVILNTDRHFGNFGFLVDSRTNRIIAPAPLFDHGNSLLNYAGTDALRDEKSIIKYAGTQLPCVYDDFIAEALLFLIHEQKNRLCRLLDFRIQKHRRYNLSDHRIILLETVIHNQVKKLIG